MGSFIDYLTTPGTLEALREQFIAHFILSAVPIAGGIVVGVLLGVVAFKVPRVRTAILSFTALLLTLPSLALFALFIPLVGIGNAGPMFGLFLYSLLPITRNTLSGLDQVDRAIAESARGMGMTTLQRLWKIELPNAWPVILTGIRVATLLVVGIGAVAALVGGTGLGEEIFQRGIRRIGSTGAIEALLGGTLGIIVLAVLFDLLYVVIGRFTVSKGIK